MFRLDLRSRRAPARREDDVDWNAILADVQAALQSGSVVDEAFSQIEQAVNAFVEDTRAKATQLLSQIATVRSLAQEQASKYDDIDVEIFGADDVPAQVQDVFNDVSNGDYDSELDDLAAPLENILG